MLEDMAARKLNPTRRHALRLHARCRDGPGRSLLVDLRPHGTACLARRVVAGLALVERSNSMKAGAEV